MFDVPVDGVYVWLGVAVVGLVVLGVVAAMPRASPPDASAAARAVDTVAVGPVGSRTTHELTAERVRIAPDSIGLAGPGGRAHAAFGYGPVTPAVADPRLERLLAGEPPAAVYSSRPELERAADAARSTSPDWRPAPAELRVRTVAWGDVRVTLVG